MKEKIVGLVGLLLLSISLLWNIFAWGFYLPFIVQGRVAYFPALDDFFILATQYHLDMAQWISTIQLLGFCMVAGYVIFWRESK